MPKTPRVRTLTAGQHVKRSETLLKFSRQYLFDIVWSLWKEVRSTYSALVLSEILRLFVNLLTPHESYYVSVKASV